jgi:hypothetical protein
MANMRKKYCNPILRFAVLLISGTMIVDMRTSPTQNVHAFTPVSRYSMSHLLHYPSYMQQQKSLPCHWYGITISTHYRSTVSLASSKQSSFGKGSKATPVKKELARNATRSIHDLEEQQAVVPPSLSHELQAAFGERKKLLASTDETTTTKTTNNSNKQSASPITTKAASNRIAPPILTTPSLRPPSLINNDDTTTQSDASKSKINSDNNDDEDTGEFLTLDAAFPGVNPLLDNIWVSREASPRSSNKDSNETTTSEAGQRVHYYSKVNRWKRNLLQETIRAYKGELWRDVQSPWSTESHIVEKLAALVQASAVRTTTDSNLLDGPWAQVYQSQDSTVYDLKTWGQEPNPALNTSATSRWNWLLPSRFRPSRRRRSDSYNLNRRRFRRTAGKESWWRNHQRIYALEDLPDHEDAHVVDQTYYLSGLITRRRQWPIRSLTRQSIRLQPALTEWSLLHHTIPLWKTSTSNSLVPLSWDIVYSDVDLCIVVSDDDSIKGRRGTRKGGNKDDGTVEDDNADDLHKRYTVFTKNEQWLDPRIRRSRKVQAAINYLPELVGHTFSPLLRRRRRSWLDLSQDSMLRVITSSSSEGGDVSPNLVRVLKLGDVSSTESGGDDRDTDEAWDSQYDPLVHLSPSERQAVLKGMSVSEIEELGQWRQQRHRKKRFLEKFLPSRKRKTYYKKSYDSDEP